MATFTNRATLSYTGGIVDSNTVTGEILDVLSASKIAVMDDYVARDEITYVIALRNTGTTTLTGITVTDNLGEYTFGAETLYPLTYVSDSIQYYVNGVIQPAPVVTAGPPLTISGIAVPAGGSAILIYEAEANAFAPLAAGDSITNTAVITGGGISAPLIVSETVSAEERADLTISKALCPATVTENGQLTYTFVIQNTGNTAAVATDNVVITDVFEPVLNPIAVTFNGDPWTEGVQYTYDTTTGEFATVAGQVTVPAATYVQNPDGTWTVTPGVSTLVVTGTV